MFRLLDLSLELRLRLVELFEHLGSLVDVLLHGSDVAVGLVDSVLVDCNAKARRDERKISLASLHPVASGRGGRGSKKREE